MRLCKNMFLLLTCLWPEPDHMIQTSFIHHFAKWKRLNPECAKFVKKSKSRHVQTCRDYSLDMSRPIQRRSGNPDLSSGCPGIQDLSSGCPGRQILPEWVLCFLFQNLLPSVEAEVIVLHSSCFSI